MIRAQRPRRKTISCIGQLFSGLGLGGRGGADAGREEVPVVEVAEPEGAQLGLNPIHASPDIEIYACMLYIFVTPSALERSLAALASTAVAVETQVVRKVLSFTAPSQRGPSSIPSGVVCIPTRSTHLIQIVRDRNSIT